MLQKELYSTHCLYKFYVIEEHAKLSFSLQNSRKFYEKCVQNLIRLFYGITLAGFRKYYFIFTALVIRSSPLYS